MTIPRPRPALIKTESGTVQLAAPHASILAVDVTREPRTKKPKKKAKKDDEPVELVVRLSRGDRKRLRRKAATYGWTVDEAAAHLLRVWSDAPSA